MKIRGSDLTACVLCPAMAPRWSRPQGGGFYNSVGDLTALRPHHRALWHAGENLGSECCAWKQKFIAPAGASAFNIARPNPLFTRPPQPPASTPEPGRRGRVIQRPGCVRPGRGAGQNRSSRAPWETLPLLAQLAATLREFVFSPNKRQASAQSEPEAAADGTPGVPEARARAYPGGGRASGHPPRLYQGPPGSRTTVRGKRTRGTWSVGRTECKPINLTRAMYCWAPSLSFP